MEVGRKKKAFYILGYLLELIIQIWQFEKNSPNPPPSFSRFEPFQLDEAPVLTWGGFFVFFWGVPCPLGLPALS
jgi:hypothetical protein